MVVTQEVGVTERVFRLILGSLLWLALLASLYLNTLIPLYCLIGLLLFEGVTNFRIPIIISRIRYGKNFNDQIDNSVCGSLICKLEAERMLRFIVVVFVLVPFFVLPDLIWFMPWFVTGMLILAGITNICPMVMFLRWAGLR